MIEGSTEARLRVYAMPAFFLLVIFVAIYFGEIAPFSISIDDELAISRKAADIWAAQGRWGVYLVESYILPTPVVPGFPVTLYGICTVLAYLFTLSSLRLPLKAPAYLLFPLFAAHPAVFALLEFYANIAAAGLGLLSVCVATYCYSLMFGRPHSRGRVVGLVAAQIALGAFAAGCYQSFIFMQAILGLGVSLADVMRGESDAPGLVSRTLALVAVLLGVLVAYYVAMKISLWALGLDLVYIQGFLNTEALAADPVGVILSTIREARAIYLGSPLTYGEPIRFMGATVAVSLATAALMIFRRRGALIGALCLIALVAVLGVPFVQHPLSNGWMPLRSLVGVPAAVWLIAALAVAIAPVWIGRAILTLAVIAAVQFALLLSQQQASSTLLRIYDQGLAARLQSRIEQAVPTFDRSRTYTLDVFGGQNFIPPYMAGPRSGSTVGGSFFGWDGGSNERILAYFRLLGLGSYKEATHEQRMAFVNKFEQMPIWPQDGSVQLYEGAILVRLSELPGVSHQAIVADREARQVATIPEGAPLFQLSTSPQGRWKATNMKAVSETLEGWRFEPGNDPWITFSSGNPDAMRQCKALWVRADVKMERPDVAQLFWMPSGKGYVEEASQKKAVTPKGAGWFDLRYYVKSPGGFDDELRLDAVTGSQPHTIRDLEVRCAERR